jgi:drug/metabolite transporter (DMT)-like permease
MKSVLKNVYFNIILNSIFWGLTPVFVKLVLNDLSAERFMFFRFLIAAIFTIPITLHLFGFKRVVGSFFSFRNLVVMAFSVGITTYLNMLALNYISATLFAIVGALRPVIADIIGSLMLREKIEKDEIIGTIIALVGTVFFVGLHAHLSGMTLASGEIRSTLIGISYTLLLSLLWVFANIALKGVAAKDKVLVSYNSFLLSLIFSVVLLYFTDPVGFVIPTLHLNIWLAICFTSIVGGIFAMMTYQKALLKIEVSEANLFYYLQIIFTIPAAIIILHEPFNLILLFPISIILIGIYLNIRKKFVYRT